MNEFKNAGVYNETTKPIYFQIVRCYVQLDEWNDYTPGAVSPEKMQEAKVIIESMKNINPTLDRCADIALGRYDKNKQTTNSDTTEKKMDISPIKETVEGCMRELQNMRGWDTDRAEDIEWKLKKCRDELESNENKIDPEEYAKLKGRITKAIYTIEDKTEALEKAERLAM